MDRWLLIGAVNGFIAVAAGAFGAHGLEGRVSATDHAAFLTGAHYHLVHALAIVVASVLLARDPSRSAFTAAAWLFLTGIILFSGSLYVLGATGSRALVLITPLGGVAFLAGWAMLVRAALQRVP